MTITADVNGRARFDGVEAFLASRGIILPCGEPGDLPDRETICGLGNRKNIQFVAEVRDRGVEPFESTRRFVRTLRRLDIPTAVVSPARTPPRSSTRPVHLGCSPCGSTESMPQPCDSPANPTLHCSSKRRGVSQSSRSTPRWWRTRTPESRRADGAVFGLVMGVDRSGQADALVALGADVVVADLAELPIDERGSWTVLLDDQLDG